MVVAKEDIDYGLWYRVTIAPGTFQIGLYVMPETYTCDIAKG